MTPQEFRDAVEYNGGRWDAGAISMEQYTMLVYSYQLQREDLADDGRGGPLTMGTLDNLYTELFEETAPHQWAPFDGPLNEQPTNRKSLYEMFGDPGQRAADDVWRKRNIMYCHKSNGNRLPGIPTQWWVAIHKDVEPYLREALRRAQIAAPSYKIERIGGYVWRPLRHKVGNPLSTHSWGVSVDVNPHLNYGRTFAKGEAPKAWSPAWYRVWPKNQGVPLEFVSAFTSCGFVWGADWDEDGLTHDHTYVDPMHFEWIARNGYSIV